MGNHGCPSCGFSYCNKCLQFKCELSKLGPGQHKVCRECSEHGGQPPKRHYEPPAALIRRLESLENPAGPPITVYTPNPRMVELKSGLEEPDRQIAERLEKLRADRKKGPAPTEEEVVSRLARLRGQSYIPANTKPTYTAPDTRTDQEKADSLLNQFAEEKQLLDKLPSPEQEIAERLNKLRRESTSPQDEVTALMRQLSTQSGSAHSGKDVQDCPRAAESQDVSMESDGENEEEMARKIMASALLEAELDKKAGVLVGSSSEELSDSDKEDKSESPWCIICNEDATLQCTDCDGDLYCNECFSKGHREWGMTDHKARPFNH
ncbi:unnamed protein product [Timema podura]|uniref:Abscission/NoCut checkpoint regulator n=1 Tax=Timema podura TaxID=61482 RepID=A0ABN7NLJ1_TIMPD|nr:unnamed protein product [Timema podura]